MKKYNVKNYIRWKEDVVDSIKQIEKKAEFADYSKKELNILSSNNPGQKSQNDRRGARPQKRPFKQFNVSRETIFI